VLEDQEMLFLGESWCRLIFLLLMVALRSPFSQIAMRPFSESKCGYELRLTLLKRQISIGTDSEAIFQIFSDVFGSRYFAPAPTGQLIPFYCGIFCEPPWDFAILLPDELSLARRSRNRPEVLDVFEWTPAGLEPRGFFTNAKPSLEATLELCASHFQRRILSFLASEHPGLRLVHAASLAHQGTGALVLGTSKGGKSTLTMACVQAGMQFLSDDTTPVDLRRGLIFPFPRALRMRKSGINLAAQFQNLSVGTVIDALGETRYYLHPERLHDNVLGSTSKLTHIIRLMGFKDRPELQSTGRGAVTASCVEADCFATGDEALNLMWDWAELTRTVKCVELWSGPPADTAKLLKEFLERE
jgi:hypothetical protein